MYVTSRPQSPDRGLLNGLHCKDRYYLDNQTKICQGMKYEFYTSGLTYGESESSENGECAPESAIVRRIGGFREFRRIGE